MTTDNVEIPSKKAAILDSTLRLFRQLGYRKATIEDICKDAGTSKVTFYKYFDNKEDVARATLKNIFETTRKRANEIIAEEKDFSTRITRVTRLKLQTFQSMGSLLLEEMFSKDSPLREFITKHQDDLKKLRKGSLKDAKAKGAINPKLDIDFLDHMFGQILPLLMNSDLAAIYPDFDTRFENMTQLFFFGIIKRNEQTGQK